MTMLAERRENAKRVGYVCNPPRFGDRTACGAEVVDSWMMPGGDRFILLAHWAQQYQPWVVWYADAREQDANQIQVYSGVYCHRLERAMEVVRDRLAKAAGG